MIHLRSITLKQSGGQEVFPFNLPIVRSLSTIELPSEVAILVGENGSGKSTLLEAIACAVGSITVGSENVGTDKTLASVRSLADRLKLTWSKRTRRGFFMRSEDFFGYVRRMSQTREELESDLKGIDERYKGRSDYARNLARMPYMRELGEMQRAYGDDLDSYSHGESYFTLFKSRFVPGGLYLLDEPEAPLSPMRQMSFITMLNMMVQQDAQFIIATHSPILMAFPGATIFNFDGEKIEQADYDSLEHVIITRNFLNNREIYLKHLLEE